MSYFNEEKSKHRAYVIPGGIIVHNNKFLSLILDKYVTRESFLSDCFVAYAKKAIGFINMYYIEIIHYAIKNNRISLLVYEFLK